MKRNLMRIMSLLIVLTLIFSFGACGILDKLKEPITGDDALPDPDPTPTRGLSSSIFSTDKKQFSSVEEYAKDPDVREKFAQITREKIAIKDMLSDVSVYALNNTLVYNMYFDDDALTNVDESDLADSLTADLQSKELSDIFEGIVNDMSSAVNDKNVSLLVVYSKSDFITTIASMEYLPKNTKTADGKYATVKDFLADPDVKAELNKAIADMVDEDNGITVILDGSERCLLYNFIFSDEVMSTVDETALCNSLAEGLENRDMVNTFEEIANSVADVVLVEPVIVSVNYSKTDGTILASKEFFSTNTENNNSFDIADPFVGTWKSDSNVLEITSRGEKGKYSVTLTVYPWPAKYATWTYEAEYNAKTGNLDCRNGIRIDHGKAASDKTVVYEGDGAAEILISDGGSLSFVSTSACPEDDGVLPSPIIFRTDGSTATPKPPASLGLSQYYGFYNSKDVGLFWVTLDRGSDDASFYVYIEYESMLKKGDVHADIKPDGESYMTFSADGMTGSDGIVRDMGSIEGAVSLEILDDGTLHMILYASKNKDDTPFDVILEPGTRF